MLFIVACNEDVDDADDDDDNEMSINCADDRVYYHGSHSNDGVEGGKSVLSPSTPVNRAEIHNTRTNVQNYIQRQLSYSSSPFYSHNGIEICRHERKYRIKKDEKELV